MLDCPQKLDTRRKVDDGHPLVWVYSLRNDLTGLAKAARIL